MSRMTSLIGATALVFAMPVPAQVAPVLRATDIGRWSAAEVRQGVVVDARHFYAVANATIGKYNKATARRVGG